MIADYRSLSSAGLPLQRQAPSAPMPLAQARCTRRGPWLQIASPARFELNQIDLPVEDLPPSLDGLRIAHLSDLHLRRYWTGGYDELIRRLDDDPPDLLLITGDFVDSKSNPRPALPVLRRLVGQLRARHGSFGILGNHDSDLIGPLLGELGVRMLDGRRETVTCRGAVIELIGLPGVERFDLTASLLRRFPPRTAGVPRIVLSHYPDTINQCGGLDADLLLTGHSHGGQICLPGGRALITHDSLPKSMCKGLCRCGRTWMVINRGFGFAGPPVRLFCPSELIDIRLNGPRMNADGHG